MSKIKKSMYKPKDENVQKLKEYLKTQEKTDNTIFVIKTQDNHE